MNSKKRYLITCALPYANGFIHIGHIAGSCLPADIYARYLRLQERDIIFIGGSDEYGAAIMLKAQKEGVEPKTIIDKYHYANRASLAKIGISYDLYHRTSDPLHHQVAQDFFLTLEQKGAFKIEEREQYYDTDYNQFLADRFITGTCPKCESPGAYGDQCEVCGSSLQSTDLIDPVSTLSGKKPILKKTQHWYLPMEDHEDWLKKWINTGYLNGSKHHDPKKWKAHVLGQCNAWLDMGLQPRAMTRDLTWGIPVPLKAAAGKVLYVWLDAPIGYISATQAWAKNKGTDWRAYWQSETTKLVHFLGKDNIVFHCLIFPILLKLHGDYILPDNIPANNFLNLETNKMSTSRNWAVWIDAYLEDFPGQEDVLRYVLTILAPENKDSEFTWRIFQERNNHELLAIFGNFVNRAIVLTHKYYKGLVPLPGQLNQADEEVKTALKTIPAEVATYLEAYKFKQGLNRAMDLARLGNKYMTEQEPWKLIKTDPARTATILHLNLQIVAHLSLILKPFLPFSAQKLEKMLNLEPLFWSAAGSTDLLPTGHQIGKAKLLFKRIEDKIVTEQIEKLGK